MGVTVRILMAVAAPILAKPELPMLAQPAQNRMPKFLASNFAAHRRAAGSPLAQGDPKAARRRAACLTATCTAGKADLSVATLAATTSACSATVASRTATDP